ncbi:hypothetical protein A3715_19960 [Oleiphilus sp. HI0009]|nr:hypothetical protein A3715_15255 [Oleiphilus sp. HI0009]KZX78638.1 hypothetical protein A3715_19960 [Oleiphilus sp. HI0009]
MPELIDYTQEFKDFYPSSNILLAQGQEYNFLSIEKLEHPIKRADGKLGRYEVGYRWLSTECESKNDEAWCCVQGNELSYWQTKEIKTLLAELKTKSSSEVNIFDHFQLY